jgi:hypothetical protein
MTPALPDDWIEQIADAIHSRIAARLGDSDTSPWKNTPEAIEYTRIPEGTFRKLAAARAIPSHGGRTRIFHRNDLDRLVREFERSQPLLPYRARRETRS